MAKVFQKAFQKAFQPSVFPPGWWTAIRDGGFDDGKADTDYTGRLVADGGAADTNYTGRPVLNGGDAT